MYAIRHKPRYLRARVERSRKHILLLLAGELHEVLAGMNCLSLSFNTLLLWR